MRAEADRVRELPLVLDAREVERADADAVGRDPRRTPRRGSLLRAEELVERGRERGDVRVPRRRRRSRAAAPAARAGAAGPTPLLATRAAASCVAPILSPTSSRRVLASSARASCAAGLRRRRLASFCSDPISVLHLGGTGAGRWSEGAGAWTSSGEAAALEQAGSWSGRLVRENATSDGDDARAASGRRATAPSSACRASVLVCMTE